MTQIPLQPEDIAKLRWVIDPALSPDGATGAYVLRDVHPRNPEEEYRYRLMLVDIDNPDSTGESGRNLLPRLDAVIRSPAWSPDGSQIAFLCNLSGSHQIWTYDLAGGRVGQITDHEHAVSEFEWSPDGRWFAYAAHTTWDDPALGEYKANRYAVVRRLPFKVDTIGYWRGTWAQVYVAPNRQHETDPLDDTALGAGEPLQLTSDAFNKTSVRWSPDGQKIAFVSTRGIDPEETRWRDVSIVDLNLSGESASAGETRQATSDLAVSAVDWSPDGQTLALVAHDSSEDRATNSGVWVTRLSDGAIVNLTADIDRPTGDHVTDDMNADSATVRPTWSSDGSSIYALMSDCARTWVVQVPFAGDEVYEKGVAVSHLDPVRDDQWADTMFGVTPIDAEDHRVFGYSFNRKNRVLVTMSTPEHPGDVFALSLDGSATPERKRLTNVNAGLLSQRKVSRPETVRFEGSEGREIEGWLLLPTNDAEAPYPLLLHIHGGPHSAYSMVFNYELQQLAADGYAVIYSNPHGSHTYGRAINTGSRCDLGGKDYNDLMLAVDAVLDRPDIDENRLGVAGGSYGGYMVNYTITQTNRFKAACAQRSSTDRVSRFFMGSEGFRHARWEAPGLPWDHLEYFTSTSTPLLAPQVETPLMLVHSELDTICPVQLAEEQFTALKMLHKTVEMVVFLGEYHYLLRLGKPANRVERLRRITGWFDKYV